jgi:hypothetical protein
LIQSLGQTVDRIVYTRYQRIYHLTVPHNRATGFSGKIAEFAKKTATDSAAVPPRNREK